MGSGDGRAARDVHWRCGNHLCAVTPDGRIAVADDGRGQIHVLEILLSGREGIGVTARSRRAPGRGCRDSARAGGRRCRLRRSARACAAGCGAPRRRASGRRRLRSRARVRLRRRSISLRKLTISSIQPRRGGSAGECSSSSRCSMMRAVQLRSASRRSAPNRRSPRQCASMSSGDIRPGAREASQLARLRLRPGEEVLLVEPVGGRFH